MDCTTNKDHALNLGSLRDRRTFNNEKLLLYNYLEKAMKVNIDDLIVLTKTIFILITSKDYEGVSYVNEVKTVLRLILEKIIFLVPLSDNVIDLFYTIYEKDFVENVQTRLETNCVHVKIFLKPESKSEFFYKYKHIFGEIALFFKMLYNQDFKFQFV